MPLAAIANTGGALLGALAPIVVAIGAVAVFLNYELNRKALETTQRQNRKCAPRAARSRMYPTQKSIPRRARMPRS